MPRKNYRSTTIKEDLYNKVEDAAKDQKKSVSQFITECLQTALAQQEAHIDG